MSAESENRAQTPEMLRTQVQQKSGAKRFFERASAVAGRVLAVLDFTDDIWDRPPSPARPQVNEDRFNMIFMLASMATFCIEMLAVWVGPRAIGSIWEWFLWLSLSAIGYVMVKRFDKPMASAIGLVILAFSLYAALGSFVMAVWDVSLVLPVLVAMILSWSTAGYRLMSSRQPTRKRIYLIWLVAAVVGVVFCLLLANLFGLASGNTGGIVGLLAAAILSLVAVHGWFRLDKVEDRSADSAVDCAAASSAGVVSDVARFLRYRIGLL